MHVVLLLPQHRQQAADVLREVNQLLGWQHGEQMGEVRPFPTCPPANPKIRQISAAAAISASVLAFTIGWFAEPPISWSHHGNVCAGSPVARSGLGGLAQ